MINGGYCDLQAAIQSEKPDDLPAGINVKTDDTLVTCTCHKKALSLMNSFVLLINKKLEMALALSALELLVVEEKREEQCRQIGLNRDILKELCRELENSETSDLKSFAWLVPSLSHMLSNQSFSGKTHSYCLPKFITAVRSSVTFLV